MRELKFRVWNIKEKKWQPYQEWQEADPNGQSTASGTIELKNDEFFHFMQYTGLKDKNGKEIYEGDVVANELNPKGHTITSLLKAFEMWQCCESLSSSNDWEVIGNIYENPELLENNQ